MKDKVTEIINRYRAIDDTLLASNITQEERKTLGKEKAEFEEAHTVATQLQTLYNELNMAKKDIQDSELKTLAEEIISETTEKIKSLQNTLQLLLIPQDPRDSKNAIMEIRAGTGGEEAALFVANLYRMYTLYIQKMKWKTSLIDMDSTDIKGYSSINFQINGQQVFGRLKYEAGTHRVQRVPATESQGRVHTSAVTIAVLPVLENEDTHIQIDPSELRVDTYRSSGAGGQHVNTTDSAVRITHLPTGIVAKSQAERSQHRNREIAMNALKAKIADKLYHDQKESLDSTRKQQIGSGDRSERIRTYNYPQHRVTDHRIGLTLYKLQEILDGDLDLFITKLKEKDTEMALSNL